jgi:xanthine dehydrogenase accessory factor
MNPGQPPPDLLKAIVDLADQGSGFAVALVLHAAGSTPCKPGARAIITDAGVIMGTIGGGFVEAEAQRHAGEAIRSGCPVVLDFDLAGGVADDDRPVCGGTMRVLVAAAAARHRAAFAEAAALRRRRERGVLLTVVRGADPWEVSVRCHGAEATTPDSGFPGAETVRRALEREQPTSFVSEPSAVGERVEVLVEPLVPKPVLVIVGGGHVGQAVAVQASLVGFDIVVLDDRPEFTAPALFPSGVATTCGSIGETLASLPFGPDTFIVIVTRGHAHDAEALAACLHQPAAYVGMIGSRRKVAQMRQEFIATGRATAEEFDRVHAPIGLDIGAATVPEIATSIVAQLISVRRQGRV